MTLTPTTSVVEQGKELTPPSEDAVFHRVLDGKTKEAMARELGISECMVQMHLKSLLERTAGDSRQQIEQQFNEPLEAQKPDTVTIGWSRASALEAALAEVPEALTDFDTGRLEVRGARLMAMEMALERLRGTARH